VFWSINHYETYCEENGLKINERLYCNGTSPGGSFPVIFRPFDAAGKLPGKRR
jgi:hypothetical protein